MQQFGGPLREQLDLSTEASNLALFTANFKNRPDVRFPEPLRPLVRGAAPASSTAETGSSSPASRSKPACAWGSGSGSGPLSCPPSATCAGIAVGACGDVRGGHAHQRLPAHAQRAVLLAGAQRRGHLPAHDAKAQPHPRRPAPGCAANKPQRLDQHGRDDRLCVCIGQPCWLLQTALASRVGRRRRCSDAGLAARSTAGRRVPHGSKSDRTLARLHVAPFLPGPQATSLCARRRRRRR